MSPDERDDDRHGDHRDAREDARAFARARDRDDVASGAVVPERDAAIGSASDDDVEIAMSPLGALSRRVAALVYDALLLVAVLFIVTALALVPSGGRAIESPLYLLVALAVAWLFFDWFWRHGGQTLGMRAWRLKLVDDGAGSLTRGRTLARFALGCALFGITLLAIPFDARRRAMHDRLTRTRVVRVAKG